MGDHLKWCAKMVLTYGASSVNKTVSGLRLGLCCLFSREPIKFRTTTATAMLRLPRAVRLARLADLCRSNAEALQSFLAGKGLI